LIEKKYKIKVKGLLLKAQTALNAWFYLWSLQKKFDFVSIVNSYTAG